MRVTPQVGPPKRRGRGKCLARLRTTVNQISLMKPLRLHIFVI